MSVCQTPHPTLSLSLSLALSLSLSLTLSPSHCTTNFIKHFFLSFSKIFFSHQFGVDQDAAEYSYNKQILIDETACDAHLAVQIQGHTLGDLTTTKTTTAFINRAASDTHLTVQIQGHVFVGLTTTTTTLISGAAPDTY